MSSVIEKPQHLSITSTEKLFFRVFLEFRKPCGGVSFFHDDGESGCGVYSALAKIFQRPPREIYDAICDLAFNKGTGFMQEYLSLDDASGAMTKAILFADTAGCVCFLRQQARFYIKEEKK